MNLEPLHFQHTFNTGRTISLTFIRHAGCKPTVEHKGPKADELDAEELDEFRKWRMQVLAVVMTKLEPDEVFATAEWAQQRTTAKGLGL